MTRGIVRTIALASMLSLPALALANPEAESGPLDGKTFDVMVVDLATGEEQADLLNFAAGTFDSVACRQYGFGKVRYEAKQDGESWTFSAEATSAEEGATAWLGTVIGDHIEGTLVWTKAGQEPGYYDFEGALAPQP